MAGFVKGDVVVIPFPFSDLSGNKRRPALVLATLPGNDIILCQISSRNRKDKFTTALSLTDFISKTAIVHFLALNLSKNNTWIFQF